MMDIHRFRPPVEIMDIHQFVGTPIADIQRLREDKKWMSRIGFRRFASAPIVDIHGLGEDRKWMSTIDYGFGGGSWAGGGVSVR